ncbi:putative TPR_REGION domain-containing protein [Desulfovibrionales bacterium]
MNTDQRLSRRDLLFGFMNRISKNIETIVVKTEFKSHSKGKDLAAMRADGFEAFRTGNWSATVDLLRPYVKMFPDELATRALLGLALYRLELYLHAKIEFDRIRYQKNDHRLALIGQGLCNLRLGKDDKAIEAWQAYPTPTDDLIRSELERQIYNLSPDIELPLDAVARAVEHFLSGRELEILKES